jgi:hypothetical protein
MWFALGVFALDVFASGGETFNRSAAALGIGCLLAAALSGGQRSVIGGVKTGGWAGRGYRRSVAGIDWSSSKRLKKRSFLFATDAINKKLAAR